MSKKTTTTKTNRRSAKKDDVSVENKKTDNTSGGMLSNVTVINGDMNPGACDDVKRRKELAKLSQQALVEMVLAKEDVIRTLKNLINTLSDKIAAQPTIQFPSITAPADEPVPLLPRVSPPGINTPDTPWWSDPSRVIMCHATCEVEQS